MIPSVEITKVDGQAGGVRPAATGQLAIIAPSSGGTDNTPVTSVRQDLVLAEFLHGRLAEFAAYCFPVTKKPVVCVKGDASTPGDYSAITTTADGGTSAITEGVTEPVDEFDCAVEFLVGGTVGQAGMKYRTSINGGKSWSKSLALGTGNTLTIPDTGVSLALGAGTIATGRKLTFTTTAPQLSNVDIVDALEALRVTSQRFEAVLIDMEADDETVSICHAWVQNLNAQKGKFPTVVLTARRRASDETEEEYRTALEGIFDAAVGTDVFVCADLDDITSNIRGILQPRPTGLASAARMVSQRLGVDPAYVALGPLAGVRITDARGNPKYHDESNFPGLDDLRLTTHRTIEGFEGVYITNMRLMSAAGSSYVYAQHARTTNRAGEIAYQVFTRELSVGVNKAPKPGPNGERYIAEEDAQRLESLANDVILRELVAPGEVSDMRAILSRSDDISSNEGAVINVAIESVSLAYVKKFKIALGFVKSISTDT